VWPKPTDGKEARREHPDCPRKYLENLATAQVEQHNPGWKETTHVIGSFALHSNVPTLQLSFPVGRILEIPCRPEQ